MPQTQKKPTATKSRAPAKKPPEASGGRGGAAQQQPKANPVRREVGAVICLLLALFSFIGYFTGSGVFISFFADLLKSLVGAGFYAVPPLLLWSAVVLAFHRGRPVRLRVVMTLLLAVFIGAIWHLFAVAADAYPLSFAMFSGLWAGGAQLESGGAAAGSLAELLRYLFSQAGAAAVLIIVALVALLIAFNRTLAQIVDAVKSRPKRAYEPPPESEPVPQKPAPAPPIPVTRKRRQAIDIPMDEEPEAPPAAPRAAAKFSDIPNPKDKDAPLFDATPRVATPAEVVSSQADPKAAAAAAETTLADAGYDMPLDIPFMEDRPSKLEARKPKAKKIDIPVEPAPEPEIPMPVAEPPYVFPDVALLAAAESPSKVDGMSEVRQNTERLEAAFRSFGVNVKISNATRGPAVTRYEAELEAGVKLNRLTSLSDDIALSLGSSGVRIAAMPNRISTVGIEVPNKHISRVNLREIIESREFRLAPSKLTFAIGKNISGEAVVGNISKLPHLLVAGTTGSGKSVCLNSLILSILYKSTPDEVRFIMIDPKMVEFQVYNGIPHLLVPVVTDVKKASGALQWAVVEMMKRYRLFSEAGARDLEGYNSIVRDGPSIDGAEEEPLPQIVVVIDELADLMLMAAKEVEESICRVAQMGRAAGVHLVIATQSPRADVITGLMKANIPSRIALKVSSALESRIILDAGGAADKLVGNGDMLFAPMGTNKPARVQGTWVSDSEREEVVKFLKKRSEPSYSDEVIHEIDRAAEEKKSKDDEADDTPKNDFDELLPQAVDVIFETGQASVSMLQRRLKLGYSRAARIVDQMEQLGVVGPFEGSKPRQLLVTREGWREMQYSSGVAPVDSGQWTVDSGQLAEDDDI